MVALVHVYNLLCALDEQQTNLCSSLFSLRFKSVKALSSRGGGVPPLQVYWGSTPCPPPVHTRIVGEQNYFDSLTSNIFLEYYLASSYFPNIFRAF